jgi:hypothetical protein
MIASVLQKKYFLSALTRFTSHIKGISAQIPCYDEVDEKINYF